MNEKLKKKWSSISFRYRLVIIFTISLTLVAVPIMALAASNVSLNNPLPANGTTTSNSKPTVSVKATATEGTISQEDITMTIGGVAVTPSYSSSTGLISYTPTVKLVDKSHSVVVGVYDAILKGSKTITWSFTVDAVPNPSNWKPAKGATVTLTYPQVPEISLYVKDIADRLDTRSVRATINGTSTAAELKLKGYTDYDYDTGDPIWVVTSEKEGTITLKNPILNDGINTIVVGIADINGNVLEETWSFNFVRVYAKPTISGEAPNIYGITDLTPTVSATVKSTNGTINPQSIVLKIDGETVNHLYNSTIGQVSYTPSSALQDESYHEVSLTVADTAGQSETKTWKFHTSTYPDMYDANLDSCTTCHALTPILDSKGNIVSNGPFEEVHGKKLSFSGYHFPDNRCNNCHDYITQSASCSQCHPDEGYDEYGPHGSNPAIRYSARNPVKGALLRVTANREMWDCIICHQPGAGTKGYVGYEAVPSRLLNNHDLPELHKTTTYTEGGECNQCHAQSLTREHAREGRVDQDNKIITCNTCHQSSDEKVKTAIANHKTDCASCHTSANHQSIHTYNGLNSNCTSCHSNVLTTEHTNQGLNCASCHDSATNESYSPDFKQGVNIAMTWSQLSCSECHSGTSSHGVNFAKTLPDDLKYGLLNWMSPSSLDYWLGEPWVPTDMAEGLYTMTKRSTDLSATEVYNYYKEKMAQLGWSKASELGAGSDKFELVYTKKTAKAIIRFYNTEHYTTTVNLGLGYRIEVLYK